MGREVLSGGGESVPPLPHTSAWRSAQLIKHRDNFTIFLLSNLFTPLPPHAAPSHPFPFAVASISHLLPLCPPGAGIGQSVWQPPGWKTGVQLPAGAETFLCCTASRPALGPTQPPMQLVPVALYPMIMRPRREGDHSHLSRAKVKNGEALPSLPHTCGNYSFFSVRLKRIFWKSCTYTPSTTRE
jgi:hypothetical protein